MKSVVAFFAVILGVCLSVAVIVFSEEEEGCKRAWQNSTYPYKYEVFGGRCQIFVKHKWVHVEVPTTAEW